MFSFIFTATQTAGALGGIGWLAEQVARKKRSRKRSQRKEQEKRIQVMKGMLHQNQSQRT
jgi:hypothetical protein